MKDYFDSDEETNDEEELFFDFEEDEDDDFYNMKPRFYKKEDKKKEKKNGFDEDDFDERVARIIVSIHKNVKKNTKFSNWVEENLHHLRCAANGVK